MTREELKERILKDIGNISEDYIIAETMIEKTGEKYDAIQVKAGGSQIAMCINFDELYKLYQHCNDYEETWQQALKAINRAEKLKPDVKDLTEDIMDYQKMKNKLFACLVNRNHVPDNVPFTKWNDLVVIVKMILKDDERGAVYATMSEKMLKAWQQNINQVMYDAIQNSQKIRPERILDCIDAMIEIRQDMDEDTKQSLQQLRGTQFVLSNDVMTDGASAVLYDGVLKKMGSIMGGSFVLIPSSRHEWMAMSADAIDAEELNELIKDTNRTQLDKKDVLSDHAYVYDALTGAVKEI